MRRFQLFELEDLPWWPQRLRDAATDYLATAMQITKPYRAILPHLRRVLTENQETKILDLCSGGGGPWRSLHGELGLSVEVCLSDKFPNLPALERAARENSAFQFEIAAVDAACVPQHLSGLRTLFLAFHHFAPREALMVLQDAARNERSIAIFELTERTWRMIFLVLLSPLFVWLLTPWIRPFSWSRLLWTYIMPVVPVAVAIDGVVSCLRSYTVEELEALATQVSVANYRWEAGCVNAPGLPLRITYLIGQAG